eukprot:scaffold2352_cov103-Isochrysis_galbana.AAC.6
MTCNTEGTAVSEVATVVRNLDGIAMSGEMGNAGAIRMSRADSALLARAGQDHLGIGTHERDGDSGTALELTLDDRPDGIPSPRACRRRPGRQAPRRRGRRRSSLKEAGRNRAPAASSLDVERVLLGLGVVTRQRRATAEWCVTNFSLLGALAQGEVPDRAAINAARPVGGLRRLHVYELVEAAGQFTGLAASADAASRAERHWWRALSASSRVPPASGRRFACARRKRWQRQRHT